MKKLFIFIIPLFAVLAILAPMNDVNAGRINNKEGSNANTFFKDLQTKYNKKSADCKKHIANPKKRGAFGTFRLDCVSYSDDLLDFTDKNKAQSIVSGFQQIIATGLKAAKLVGLIVVLGGGIYYLRSSFTGDDPTEAKTKIKKGIFGLIISISAYFLVSTIFNAVSLFS